MLSKKNVVKEALLEVTDNVFHYEAIKKEDQYIAWAEDGEGSSVEADNRKENQSIQGTVDFFTKQEEDPMADQIQKALKRKRISFYLNSVQYEETTGYIHYEWIWEVG